MKSLYIKPGDKSSAAREPYIPTWSETEAFRSRVNDSLAKSGQKSISKPTKPQSQEDEVGNDHFLQVSSSFTTDMVRILPDDELVIEEHDEMQQEEEELA